MKEEYKELLLKDLCARFIYGVIVRVHDIKNGDFDSYIDSINNTCVETHPVEELTMDFNPYVFYKFQEVKPYLRPMSSITEEECQELHSICPHSTFNKTNVPGWIIGIDGSDYGRTSRIDEISKLIDWLNAHHFDYRELIEKDLALEAPKGMYNIK